MKPPPPLPVPTHPTPSAAVTGLCGLAVLALMLQSTGGLRAELLGPNLVLATGGYLTTRVLLDAAVARPDRRIPLGAWFRDHAKKRTPLLLFTLLTTLGLAALLTSPAAARQLGPAAIAGLAQAGNWFDLVLRDELVGPFGDWYADRPGQVDPFGALWLVGLVGQFSLVWPLLLAAIWLLAWRSPWLTAAMSALLAGFACLVGPVRDAAGAEFAELALGSHVRAAEWLLGAAAAAIVVARETGTTGRGRRRSHGGGNEIGDSAGHGGGGGGGGAAVAGIVALVGLVTVVASAVIATARPADWLRGGGPVAAAAGAALLLAAVDRPPGRATHPLEWLCARVVPVEVGRMAYPLLLLHLPVYWALAYAVPQVRPYALFLVAGTAAWLTGLVLQDGVVGRLRRRRWRAVRALPALVLACAAVTAGGVWVPAAAEARLHGGSGPEVLVLGGSFASDLAVTLGAHGSDRFPVVDGSLPGCGLYPEPPPAAPIGHLTGTAQLAAQPPAYSAACMNWEREWRAEIAAARPALLLVDLSADAAARVHRGAVISPCDADYRRTYRDLLTRAAALWQAAAPGRPVLLADARRATGEADEQSSRCYNALLDEAVSRHRLLTLDINGVLCPEGQCRTRTISYDPLYSDAVHLTPRAMEEIAPWLEDVVDRTLTTPAPPAAADGRGAPVSAGLGAS